MKSKIRTVQILPSRKNCCGKGHSFGHSQSISCEVIVIICFCVSLLVFVSLRLGLVWGRASVTVVALTRFELRFVVASSRCRVSALTCALASERVIAKCMLLVMTSHCLLLLHHLSLCQPKFVLFGFWITNRQHHYFSFCSTSQSTSKKSSFKFKVMFQQR